MGTQGRSEKKYVTSRSLSQFWRIADTHFVTSNGFSFADPPADLGHCASRHAPRHGCHAYLFALLRRRFTPASLRSVLTRNGSAALEK
jgi:hypothetical protein